MCLFLAADTQPQAFKHHVGLPSVDYTGILYISSILLYSIVILYGTIWWENFDETNVIHQYFTYKVAPRVHNIIYYLLLVGLILAIV